MMEKWAGVCSDFWGW